jgi:hypothetical protein
MKRLVVITVIVLLISSFAFADEYSNIVDVIVDGERLDTFDVEQGINTPAFIYNDRTMLPLKVTLEILGIDENRVSWNGVDRSVTIYSNDNKKIVIFIDQKFIRVNNVEIKIYVPPIIFNNRTYVPVSLLTSVLEEVLVWDAENRAVIINPSTYKIKEYNLSFNLNKKYGYNKPVRVSTDEGYYLSNTLTEEKNFIQVVKHENKIHDVLASEVKDFNVTTQEYTAILDTNLVYLREMASEFYSLFVDVNGITYEVLVMGLDENDVLEFSQSMKEFE